MEVDHDGFEVLDRDECLRLLATATLGRVGFTSGALPSVLPVSFHLDDERILVRTRRGTTLDAAMQNVVVAFEVDDLDSDGQTGWSVAVTGVAAAVNGPLLFEEGRADPTAGWTLAADEAVVAISTEFVTGRRSPQPPVPGLVAT
jgi:hypothetical protein